MVTFTLNSFLKISGLETAKQIAEIDKKVQNTSGYDYYHSLNRAVRAHIANEDVNQIEKILTSATNTHERENNAAAYIKFIERYGELKNIELLKQPKNLDFSKYGFSIKCDPLFIIEEKGERLVHSVWPNQNSKLSQSYATVGCLILRRTYTSSSLGNCRFCVANLNSGKRITDKNITNNTSLILEADARKIGALLIDAQT